MIVDNVIIHNAQEPTERWWKVCEQWPRKTLIHATITVQLSFAEYMKLLREDRAGRKKRDTGK